MTELDSSRLPPYAAESVRPVVVKGVRGSATRELVFANDRPLVLLAGPCALESRAHAIETSEAIAEICAPRKIDWIYKTSFDKANRTSLSSQRGLGIERALEVFAALREKGFLTMTDVHEAWHCERVASVVDVLQIPAFLCRQTDLLWAAGATGKVVNVKKGQFLAPQDMAYVAEKVERGGAGGVLLCERGTSFGYNRLVVDMTGLWEMARTGHPVVMDATHAVQRPGGGEGVSSGNRACIESLVRAASAVGVAGLFLEVHGDPDAAPSDGSNMLHIKDLGRVLDVAMELDKVAKKSL